LPAEAALDGAMSADQEHRLRARETSDKSVSAMPIAHSEAENRPFCAVSDAFFY